ncbi:hypothetical protein ACHAXR_002986 [Thalassiosira sp. AJA248-18]
MAILSAQDGSTTNATAVLCAIHLVKRCFEVLFLHIFLGRTNRWSPILISTLYAYGAIVVPSVAYSGDGNGEAMLFQQRQ